MSVMNRNVERLSEWLVRLAGDGDGTASLGHVSAVGPGVPLGRWPVRNADAPETLRQLAEDIVRAASDDAEGHPGGTPQQYVCLYYFESDPEKAGSRLTIRLSTAEQFAPEGSALVTEPPTERGLISQAIRHNEFLVKSSFGAMGAAAAQLERHNQMLGSQVTRLTEQVFEMQRERQELLDRDAERLLEIERFEADRQHRERVTSAVLSAGKGFFATLANGGKPLQLPVATTAAVKRLAAGGDAPPSDVADEDALPTVPASAVLALDQLQDLFRSLTPEQTQSIAGVLTMEQQAALMSLYYQMAGPTEDVDPAQEGAAP